MGRKLARRETAGMNVGSGSGESQEAVSEGVTGQKQVTAEGRWKARSRIPTKGHAQTSLAGRPSRCVSDSKGNGLSLPFASVGVSKPPNLFAMLSSSPPFLPPPISSCPLMYPLLCQRSLALDLPERSHYPPLQISTGTPAGSWIPMSFLCPGQAPKWDLELWALGTIASDAGKEIPCSASLLSFCIFPSSFGE